MTDSRDIGYAIFGAGFGVWYFFHGLGVLRKKKFIESIPTSTVRGLAIGLVELNGKAKKVKTLQVPSDRDRMHYFIVIRLNAWKAAAVQADGS